MPTRRIGDDCIVRIGEPYISPEGVATGGRIVWIVQKEDGDDRLHEVMLYPHEVVALISALEAARDYGKSPESQAAELTMK